MVSEHHVVFKNVKHPTHLGEDEDSRTFGLHGSKKLVEDDHLASIVDDVLISRVRWSRLGSIEN